MKLRSRIGVLIDDSEYTREDIMREFEKGRNTISNWCTGKSFPTVLEVWRLAKMLGVNVSELYKEVIEVFEVQCAGCGKFVEYLQDDGVCEKCYQERLEADE